MEIAKNEFKRRRRRYTSFAGVASLKESIQHGRMTLEEAEGSTAARDVKGDECAFCGQWRIGGECGDLGEGVCVVRAAVEDALFALSPRARPHDRRTWLAGYSFDHEMARAELRQANDAVDAVLGPWDEKRVRLAISVMRALVGRSYDPRAAAAEYDEPIAPWLAALVDSVRAAVVTAVCDERNLGLADIREAWKVRP